MFRAKNIKIICSVLLLLLLESLKCLTGYKNTFALAFDLHPQAELATSNEVYELLQKV